MNLRALSTMLAICMGLLVIAVTVSTELFVMESLLPLVGREVASIVNCCY